MSAVEKQHIIRAYTFELGKCYEQAIKERQLQALAEIDADLCEQVATGLGLPAPSATLPPTAATPSPALSQMGSRWPVDGRMVGIVVDADDPAGADGLAELSSLRSAIFRAGMVPLVIAAHGGQVAGDVPVQRTFATGRSVELDALLLAASPLPAPDALPSRDAKAGAAGGPAGSAVDPRVRLLVEECYRHAKAIGAWGRGVDALAAGGCTADDAGVVVGDSGSAVLGEVLGLLASHRVWERFPA
jgi:catalase